jgi:hypothetical protein
MPNYQALARRIGEYLGNFARNIKIRKYNFSERDEDGMRKQGVDFLCLELELVQLLEEAKYSVEDLTRELNSHMSNMNKNRAFLRVIDLREIPPQKENQKPRYIYEIEIVPNSHYSPREKAEISESVLAEIPRIVKNYKLKNCKSK